MNSFRFLLQTAAGVTLSLSSLLLTTVALAQKPPHKPGEICVTPKLWCWQKPPGKPGAPCSCLTAYGPLAGRLE